MKIAVCMKQVPDTTEIKIDPVKNTLIRKGVPSIMNPYDRHALEMALQLKDRHGAEVVALTMGPSQAIDILEEAYAMGADEVYLITDRKFGGSDTFATSYILSAALDHLGPFDLVLGGKQAIDGDTGQTISSLAQHMDCACINQVLDLQVESSPAGATNSNPTVTVKRKTDEGVEVLETTLPLVCTVMKESNKPRYASIQSTLDALEHEAQQICLDDLAALLDESKIGLKGSPTRVQKSFVPERCAEGVFIEGAPKDQAHDLVEQLVEAKLLV
ncbi:electron transfer flavoprotein subunit beta/FixA family protein [Anaerotardibacter muris]|uniref:electron transfer flavoprotein subunit beta/FixA family protein n=1 Tax=Anaerotardibacter muris TaxID=2941505 RepID=UPI00203AEE0D|nr:electron transfer flavoprotein subunit beta/FixA family protein [Anaerotardibacter muris]